MVRIVVLVVALAAGGAAAWMAMAMRPQSVVVPAQQIAAPAPAPTRDVLVAAVDVAPGQALAKDSLRWQAWPEGALNPAFIVKPARPDAAEALVGALARSRLLPGEPVLDEKLLPRNAGFLAAMLPAGRRAVAVRVSAENTAGGFVLPNDRVDVLHTATVRDKEHVTRTILRNVRVLAIDQTVDERPAKDEKAAKGTTVVVGKTATLELDPQQAEMLTAAEAAGSLSLALRSSADRNEASVALAPPPAVEPPTTRAVTVLRGGRSQTEAAKVN